MPCQGCQSRRDLACDTCGARRDFLKKSEACTNFQGLSLGHPALMSWKTDPKRSRRASTLSVSNLWVSTSTWFIPGEGQKSRRGLCKKSFFCVSNFFFFMLGIKVLWLIKKGPKIWHAFSAHKVWHLPSHQDLATLFIPPSPPDFFFGNLFILLLCRVLFLSYLQERKQQQKSYFHQQHLFSHIFSTQIFRFLKEFEGRVGQFHSKHLIHLSNGNLKEGGEKKTWQTNIMQLLPPPPPSEKKTAKPNQQRWHAKSGSSVKTCRRRTHVFSHVLAPTCVLARSGISNENFPPVGAQEEACQECVVAGWAGAPGWRWQ